MAFTTLLPNNYKLQEEAYLYKIPSNFTTSFFVNGNELSTPDFANLRLSIFQGKGIEAISDVWPLNKLTLSNGNYRVYVEDMLITSLNPGQVYYPVIYDTTTNLTLYKGNCFEFVAEADAEKFVRVSYRNSTNLFNFNYEEIPTFRNVLFLDLNVIENEPEYELTAYSEATTGFRRNEKSQLSDSFTLEAFLFDTNAHNGMKAVSLHDDIELNTLPYQIKEGYSIDTNVRSSLARGSIIFWDQSHNEINLSGASVTAIVPDVVPVWDISTAVFLQSLTVTSQDTIPVDVFLTADGLKMYMAGATNSKIYEYDLSTAFDVSTAVHNVLDFIDISAKDTSPSGVSISPDGLKMYFIGSQNDKVYEYDLSVAFDITTSVFLQDFDLSTEDTSPLGMYMRSDGLKMYFTGIQNDKVYEYDLSVAFDISTLVFNVGFSIVSQDTGSNGVFFKPDGTQMFIVGSSNDKVYEYNLSTPWNVSTAVSNQDFDLSGQALGATGLFFKSDGLKMYISNTVSFVGKIFEYDLT